MLANPTLHRLLFACLLLLAWKPCFANDTADQLATLHKARLAFLQTVSSFYRYQGSEGDPAYRQEIDNQLVDLKDQAANVNSVFQHLSLAENSKRFNEDFKLLLNQLNVALSAIAQSGFVDFSIADTYLQTNERIVDNLNQTYQYVLDSTGHKIPAYAQLLREQALIMQQMYTLYIERSTSRFGYSYRSNQSDDATIDTLAQQFDTNLQKLLKDAPNDPDVRHQLSDIKTKWAFLKKSMYNYTEKTVPFLVTKFGNRIIAVLTSLAEKLD